MILFTVDHFTTMPSLTSAGGTDIFVHMYNFGFQSKGSLGKDKKVEVGITYSVLLMTINMSILCNTPDN